MMRTQTANGGGGAKWIRREKRLAIYLRDGLACCYCGASVEDGAQLTLDHVVCRSHGGTHEAANLVTACLRCNSSRADRTVAHFARAVAAYLNHGVRATDILAHIRACRRRRIDVVAAKALIAARGGFTAALTPEEV